MDNTHIHLLLNHFPIIGTLIGTIMLLIGIWKKDFSIKNISLATIFLMALLAIPVFLTGEPAEERVENLAGVSESMMEEHEESGEQALWVMLFAGAFSLIGFTLLNLQHKASGAVILIALVLSIISTGLMARTGYLGGQIRHTEIRGNNVTGQNIEINGKTGEKDDD